MKNFFISYNSADCQWAEWIAWQLEEAGYTTVLQAWDFRPGSNFVLEMQRAATEAERTIAVLSPDYLGARFTQPEWAAAFAQDPTGEKGTLLPVRVRECDLKGLLPQIIYVDLVGLDEVSAWEELLAGVIRERAKPTAPPRFPASGRPYFPKALPPIWNVPYRRNPNFTGREGLLAELRSALTSGQPAALTQAIVGLGGVGKTQLAVEYAYRYAAEYDVVWWVRAEESATLAADYAGLAGELGLPGEDAPNQRVVVEAVRRWLGQNAGWLLVFDNARDPAELRDYLPQGATGHVLVTSRNLSWRGMASPLAVQVLERAESVDFLLKRTGQADKGGPPHWRRRWATCRWPWSRREPTSRPPEDRFADTWTCSATANGNCWAGASLPQTIPTPSPPPGRLRFNRCSGRRPPGRTCCACVPSWRPTTSHETP